MSRAEKIVCAALLLAVSVYVASEIAFWRAAMGRGSRFQVPSSREIERGTWNVEPGTWNLEPRRAPREA